MLKLMKAGMTGKLGIAMALVLTTCVVSASAFISTAPAFNKQPAFRFGLTRNRDRAARTAMTASSLPTVDISKTLGYMQRIAAIDDDLPNVKELELLVGILTIRGQEAISATDRQGLHPLVIPLTRDPKTNSVTGLLKLPLKPHTDLPVVRTVGKGLELLSSSVRLMLKRAAIEEDYNSSPYAAQVINLANECGLEVTSGASRESPLGLQRFLLVKVGPFSDLYEWLAADWLAKGKTEEALVTCSRAAALLPEWGKQHWVHSRTLTQVGDRDLEARDCARAALQLPLWTLGGDLENVVARAESTIPKMISSYTKWSLTGGPEEDLANGKRSEMQISIGRASYLMDTVMLDQSLSWDPIREKLASLYETANLRETALLVRGE